MSRILFLLCFLLPMALQATIVTGTVKDKQGNPIPMVSVICVETRNESMTDEQGSYRFVLNPGKYTLQFDALGYWPEEVIIKVSGQEQIIKPLIFKENSKELSLLEIHADAGDLAKALVRKASNVKSDLAQKYQSLQCSLYVKYSLVENKPDTTDYDDGFVPEPLPRIDIQDHLSESVSFIQKKSPRDFKEQILGQNDVSVKKPDLGYGVSFSMELGESNIAPDQFMYDNTYLVKSQTGFFEYDFNQNLLDLPSIGEKPLLSPIASTALLNYKYEVDSIFFVDSKKNFRIQFRPIFKTEALFEGYFILEDITYAIKYINVQVTPLALLWHKEFRIEQQYEEITEGVYLPIKRSIHYQIKEGSSFMNGSTLIHCFDYFLPTSFKEGTFSDLTRIYNEVAFDRDSIYWADVRREEWNALETRHAFRCDSINKLYDDPDYYREQDSTFNKIKFLDFILYGVGYRNRAKNYLLYFNPLVMQVNPVGIGGYRHRLGGTFEKEFSNNYLLETQGEVDYGFRNRDIRGKIGVGLTYIPRKFVRTFIRVGDFYDMINTYASLGSIFSRSNFVRTQSFSIAQRMEVSNGLFMELSLEFSDQKPISNLAQDRWSGQAFGDVNTPIDFQRYIKSEIRLDIQYRHRQKYILKKGKKIIIGSNYPEVKMTYRKGMPGLFRSEVDFDFLEVGISDDMELGRWGTTEWNLLAGSFLSKRNLRILEHRYFRGSDVFFFSDPLRSFQLLGPTLSTASAFLRANYFHHLNGVFFNKIPLLNRLKLTEAFGAAFLSIPDQRFNHAEIYLGIERVVRIKRELFRFGIYGATSDSSLNKARFELKLGVNFYNTWTKKWSF